MVRKVNAEALRQIYAEGLPVVRRYMRDLRELNTIFLQSWRNGTLDADWAEFRKDYPDLWLTYFVRARGMGDIKIGKSNQVGVRVKTLWSHAARGVDLVACYPSGIDHETELHREFEHLRLCGEWFRPGKQLLTHLRLVGCDPREFTNEVPPHFYRRYPHKLVGNVNDAHNEKIQEA